MIIKLDNRPQYLAETTQHHTAWYPVDFDIKTLSTEYLHKILGYLDPPTIKLIQEEYLETRFSEYETEEDYFDHYSLTLDGAVYRFHIIDQTDNSVCVYMEKPLFTLGDFKPEGYAWGCIYSCDGPESIQIKLYDHRQQFGGVTYNKLHEICDW